MTSRRLFHLARRRSPRGTLRTTFAHAWVPFTLLALVCTPLGAASQADRKKTEAELQAIKAQIGRIASQVNRDQIERDRLARELRAAELSVGSAREGLERVKSEHAQRTVRRAALAQDQHRHEVDLASARQDLASELRAAYLIGSEEPLKLLLNQQDLARAGRMFVYYSYFSRARAQDIDRVNAALGEIGRVDQALAAEETHLRDLESERQLQLSELEQARQQRSRVLANLQI